MGVQKSERGAARRSDEEGGFQGLARDLGPQDPGASPMSRGSGPGPLCESSLRYTLALGRFIVVVSLIVARFSVIISVTQQLRTQYSLHYIEITNWDDIIS
jgi:hypothetical protein